MGNAPGTAQTKPRRGVLLLNLGSPESTSVPDVRRYLNEFLMDPRVLDVSYPIRRFIVSCLILPRRPRESAAAYRLIWWEEGSPLVALSRRVERLLRGELDIPVALAMRYGRPSTEEGIKRLLEEGGGDLEEILVIPLYPHYALASYETAVVEVRRVVAKLGAGVKLEFLPPFYEDPLYIDALVESCKSHLGWDFDRLLFSYHGIPERHVQKTDPTGQHCLKVENCCAVDSPAHATCYRHQVLRTTEEFVRKAGIPKEKYSVSFQSRLGRQPWLAPATDRELIRLAESGVKKLLVICPAFVSDCLETLEEIGIRGKRDFEKAGGTELRLIPCMNDHPAWIAALKTWCSRPTDRPVADRASAGTP